MTSSSLRNRTDLFPLILLALTTIVAFITAIHSEWTNLSSLWTQCSFGGSSSIPVPLCFAVHFFQAAHASTHSRLEQAAIVSFLAALATITATEAARIRSARQEKKHWQQQSSDASKISSTGSNKLPRSLASRVIDSLTIPWLLYNCALGALAWQLILIPAFLHSPGAARPRSNQERDGPPTHSLAVPTSIALGLLVPATLMLHVNPLNPTFIILFLLFPLWISLTHRLLTALILPATTTLTESTTFALPIAASVIAHICLIIRSLTGDRTSSSSPLTRSAMLLLELDHAAIFLAVLYWLYREAEDNDSSIISPPAVVAGAMGASLLLGPGAGVCIGWMALGRQDQHDASPVPTRPLVRRRVSAKATGNFFVG